jgi:hypothetical protein
MLNDNNEFESVDKSQNIQGTFNEFSLYFEDEGLCEFEEVFNLLLETTTKSMNVEIPKPTFVNGEYNIAFSAFPVQTKALGKIATILVFIGGVQVDDETAVFFSGHAGWRPGEDEGNLDRFSQLLKLFKGITIDDSKISLNSFTPAKIIKKYVDESKLLNSYDEQQSNFVTILKDQISYSQEKTFEFDTMTFAVPDGYRMGKDDGENKGWTYIVPDNTPKSANHIDATPLSIAVTSEPCNYGQFDDSKLDKMELVLKLQGQLDASISVQRVVIDWDCSYLYQRFMMRAIQHTTRLKAFF